MWGRKVSFEATSFTKHERPLRGLCGSHGQTNGPAHTILRTLMRAQLEAQRHQVRQPKVDREVARRMGGHAGPGRWPMVVARRKKGPQGRGGRAVAVKGHGLRATFGAGFWHLDRPPLLKRLVQEAPQLSTRVKLVIAWG